MGSDLPDKPSSLPLAAPEGGMDHQERSSTRRPSSRRHRMLAGSAAAAVVLALTAATAMWWPSAPWKAHSAAARLPAMPPAPHEVPSPLPAPPPFDETYALEHPQPNLEIHAQSGILVDLDTLQVLWERDPHSRRAPASLTKLMTVLVAMDLATSLDQVVTVPASATQVEPDSTLMGLSPGERISVRDLMYGIFLESGNDAAETLASVFVPRDQFIQLMNEKAAQLGMRDTHFSNPTGLDAPDHYSSAYDLAIVAAVIAIHEPQLLAIAGTRSVVIPGDADHPEYDMRTLIRLVDVYPGATGLKTGYTDDAGYCLAATATRGGRHLLAVVLHSDTNLTTDAERLLDDGFSIPVSAEPPPPPAVDFLTQ
jgi:D-alanyl-D-alanine carboxypeptidase (penicillin-binding protein 5/6)